MSVFKVTVAIQIEFLKQPLWRKRVVGGKNPLSDASKASDSPALRLARRCGSLLVKDFFILKKYLFWLVCFSVFHSEIGFRRFSQH